jgi:broad specificity phosphatase PhoE
MKYLILLMLIPCVSRSQTIYIVRHAEKQATNANMTRMEASDPPLSDIGNERALALKETLKDKGITSIFSTKYKRTMNTARPLSEAGSLTVQSYPAMADSMDAFIGKIKSIDKGNVLIIGHSNTIDDLANKLAGTKVVPADLGENEYNNLFILEKKGDEYVFTRLTYGK